MSEFNPIDAFNGKFIFKDKYKSERKDILDFLKHVSENPATYGVPDAANRKADLQLLYNAIDSLQNPGGTHFVNPKPEQQILRKNQGVALDPTKAIPWTVNKISKEYFIIFDLLGIFLSLMGPAPTSGTAPTAKNYFLPLVVVYAKWCRKLVQYNGQAPTIAQITWSSNDSGKTWYSFLGTSAKGFVEDKDEVKSEDQKWQVLVGKTRHDFLESVLPTKYAYGNSPGIEKNAASGTNFGNCGETYPFLHVLGDSTLKHNCSGIAALVAGSYKDSEYDGSKYWNRKRIWAPCINCEHLLDYYEVGDRLPHFRLHLA